MTGAAGVDAFGRRRHSRILPPLTTNLVRAARPVPSPHRPPRGRSGGGTGAVVNRPAVLVEISFAPHGRPALNRRTSAVERSVIGGVPFDTTLGSAKNFDAASTSPRRSVSDHARITFTAVVSAVLFTGCGLGPPPSPPPPPPPGRAGR